LACGNSLRSDDGAGPWLAFWIEERFVNEPALRVIVRQQWTPDLAEAIAESAAVVFLDCAVDSAPGDVRAIDVEPAAPGGGLATHHTGAAELLGLSRALYGRVPKCARLITIGAGSTDLGERFSAPVQSALPEAARLVEKTVQLLLDDASA
jgi:hydrogenase maturation protease